MDEHHEFKKKREDFTLAIRKNNRDEILMKRRQIDTSEFETSESLEIIIVDNNLRTSLERLLKEEFVIENLEQLIDLTNSDKILDKHRAIIGLRKLTAKMTDKTEDIILERDVIRLLIPWCNQDEYPQLKLETLEFMCNIASYSKTCTKEMATLNIIDYASNALSHNNKHIVYQAIWVVGNLAADEVAYRDELLLLNCVQKILVFMEALQSKSKKITAVWTLTNLARGRPPAKYEIVKHVVPAIAESLKENIIKNEDIISDCLWTIATLSDGPKIRLQRIMETEVVPCIMERYLMHPNLSISIPTIRLIGNFTTGNSIHANMILKNGFLNYAYELLDNKKFVVVKEVCWALSNITAGTEEQILQFLIRKDLIEKLLNLYKVTNEAVKSEILWIFTNLERSDIEIGIINLFMAIGIVEMVGELISTSNDTKIIVDALNCFDKILALGERNRKNTTDKNIIVQEFMNKNYSNVLMDLQLNKIDAIYDWSSKILKRFFDVGETCVNDMADE